jgi:aspartyl-tRNA(Asn)/glutamyl-tRNA(Gln) amidotransferase subunit A
MTTWHENEAFKYVQGVYDAPVTSIGDFVSAEQATERRKDGFAAYFSAMTPCSVQ